MAAIEHVVHEYTSLLAAAHHTMFGAAPWRMHAEQAFLFHYRNLDHFLLGGGGTADIHAADYTPLETPPWDLPLWRGVWREVIDDRLDRLSYARLTQQPWCAHQWVPRLDAEVRTAWRQFYEALTDREYRAEFVRQVEMRRRELIPFHVRVELLYV
jgi:hypothetical protein